MNVTISQNIVPSEKTAAETYMNALIAAAAEDESIVCLDADLARSTGTVAFKEKYPERHFDVGIAEANMVGLASGMANRGLKPYVHSFAPFAVRRCLDQIYVSGAYSKRNIKIIGVAPGILATITGGTHMPFDDLADMISIPEMLVVEPSDNRQITWLVSELNKLDGMAYVRFDRTKLFDFYEEGSTFELGKAVQLRDGKDVTIIATGAICLNQAMLAAKKLEEENISARVLDMFTIKPLDQEAVIKAAKETGAIVTIENANELCGMGSLVASVLAKNIYAPLECLGSHDRFGEVGDLNYLLKCFHLEADDIVASVKKVITRK